jgi:DDE superfamily endonuclease
VGVEWLEPGQRTQPANKLGAGGIGGMSGCSPTLLARRYEEVWSLKSAAGPVHQRGPCYKRKRRTVIGFHVGANSEVVATTGDFAMATDIWPRVLPGAAHDLTMARTHGIIDALASAEVMTFADKGCQGASGSVRTPFKRNRHRPKLSGRQKAVNRAHARIRA